MYGHGSDDSNTVKILYFNTDGMADRSALMNEIASAAPDVVFLFDHRESSERGTLYFQLQAAMSGTSGTKKATVRVLCAPKGKDGKRYGGVAVAVQPAWNARVVGDRRNLGRHAKVEIVTASSKLCAVGTYHPPRGGGPSSVATTQETMLAGAEFHVASGWGPLTHEDGAGRKRVRVQTVNVVDLARLIGKSGDGDRTHVVVGGDMQCDWCGGSNDDLKEWKMLASKLELKKVRSSLGALRQFTYHVGKDGSSAIDWVLDSTLAGASTAANARASGLGTSQHLPVLYKCVLPGADTTRASGRALHTKQPPREPPPITNTTSKNADKFRKRRARSAAKQRREYTTCQLEKRFRAWVSGGGHFRDRNTQASWLLARRRTPLM
jgi:hypothetical protein